MSRPAESLKVPGASILGTDANRGPDIRDGLKTGTRLAPCFRWLTGYHFPGPGLACPVCS